MLVELLQLRKKIDKIDQLFLKLLAKRMQLVIAIGEFKWKKGLPIYIKERENTILELRRKEAKKIGVSADLIEDILRRIICESYKYEKKKT
ncbi:chorismate mutase [Arsenophonus symbiont of Ornithomya chloropus]|uniref:chorismate mutase n=1 Tax=Arsenophonus symbiont of Ornithomya chloropus TaxID=634121 RepID=UPI0032B1D49E